MKACFHKLFTVTFHAHTSVFLSSGQYPSPPIQYLDQDYYEIDISRKIFPAMRPIHLTHWTQSSTHKR